MPFIKKKLTIADIYLILVNLVPLYGVWFLGWDANRIFLFYCLETILIGVFNVFKMLTVIIWGKKVTAKPKEELTGFFRYFMVVFFIFHYGFFVFVQTQLFFAISNVMESRSFGISYEKVWNTLGAEGHLLLGLFASYYLLDLLFNFINNGKYKTAVLEELMFLPYVRIFVQQLVVIAGGFFLMLNANSAFILVFIGIKIVIEILSANGHLEAYLKKNMRKEKKLNNSIN